VDARLQTTEEKLQATELKLQIMELKILAIESKTKKIIIQPIREKSTLEQTFQKHRDFIAEKVCFMVCDDLATMRNCRSATS